MTLSRRDFLKLGGMVASSAALSGCAPLFEHLPGASPLETWSPMAATDFQSLNRLTFGPRTDERLRLAEIGLQGWVEEQLSPEAIEDTACELRLRNFSTLEMAANELEAFSDQLFENYDRQKVPDELRQATLLRQVYSRRQLYEAMVEFWNDHFNIATQKGDCFYLKTVDDRDVIRQHALGSFRDLVWASAHSPAMLVYLDNQANRKEAPNENYARELMELHTLGVNGGYTQQDVMELARCLTGWSVKQHFWRGDFTFKEDLHDPGDKFVLGQRILAGGQDEAESVIGILAGHPSTARFIATKLCRRFISDAPPADLVARAADAFEKTDGDIQAVLRVILLDGLSLAQPKYKRPVNFMVSALRMLNAETKGEPALQDYLLRMGQMHFTWPTPDGYPDRSEAWQGNLMPRWQFAFALVRNEIGKTRLNLRQLAETSGAQTLPEAVDALSALLLGAPLVASQRDALLESVVAAGADEEQAFQVIAGGILASPLYQWR